MICKTEAIVLHALKYGDGRLIVDLFTRQEGRRSFVVPVSHSSRSRFKKQYFQPLTLLYIESNLRPQAQLQQLKEATLLAPLPALLGDAAKLSIALFVAEFLYYALRDEQRNEQLFDYVRSSVEWLDSREQDYANFHLVFLMRLSRFLGFYPNLSDYSPNACFDLRAATFCASPPLHRDFLLPQEAARIQLLMRMDFPTMHVFRLSHTDRNRILDTLLHYYRLHLPAFPELRSLAVLQELYA